ncbi:hypothetical protein HID58_063707, partial [Brassica napus]
NHQAVRRTRQISHVRTRRPSGTIRTIKPSLSGTISRYPSRSIRVGIRTSRIRTRRTCYRRLPSETIRQSAEPAESVTSGLAGHQELSARSSHRSSVISRYPSRSIRVGIRTSRIRTRRT